MADPKYNSFLSNLNSLVPTQMFAIYLSKNRNLDDSEITLGGFNVKRTGANPFYWEELATKNAWSVNVNKILFGDAEIDDPRVMYLNTGEPYMVLSQAEFGVIERYMRGLLECSYDQDYFFFCYVRYNSYSDFPPIEIILQSVTLTIPPESYVVLVGCSFSVAPINFHNNRKIIQ